MRNFFSRKSFALTLVLFAVIGGIIINTQVVRADSLNLHLTQKDLTTWIPVEGEVTVDIAISTANNKLVATEIPNGYTLVYYPNIESYNNWTGKVWSIVGTNMNLPFSDDLNGSLNSNYCAITGSDGETKLNPNAKVCQGAKLWLVPTKDISETINDDGSQIIDWSDASNFLFETDLINYTKSNPSLISAIITSDGSSIGDLSNAVLINNDVLETKHTLSVEDVQTDTSSSLLEGEYAFNLSNVSGENTKEGLIEYFTNKNWPEYYLTQITKEIGGEAPFFFLKSDGNNTYTLVDGFQKALGEDGQPLVIDDNYPSGTYTYTGEIANKSITVSLTVRRLSDLSALTAEITVARDTLEAQATNIGDNPGQYTQNSVDILNLAITDAQKITSDDKQSVVDNAVTILTSAISAFIPVSDSDITILNENKVIAQTLIDNNAPESDIPGEHVIGSLATLSSTLSATTATNKNSQTTVDNQISALNSAITAYNLAIVPNSNIDAYNFALSAVKETDYTSASWALYQTVVLVNVVTDKNTQTEVDTATTNITNAQHNLVLAIGEATIKLTTTKNEDNTISGTISGTSEASITSNNILTTVSIPANTTIVGPEEWDGTVNMPTVATSYTLTPDSGNTTSAISAIEIGFGDIPLILDKAVKITFAGQADKLIGWSQAKTFHQITTICDDPTNPTLDSGTDCKINVGSDLVVWTKHFSTFITYTQTPIPAQTVSGGGGGGGISGRRHTTTTIAPTTSGQVLGASIVANEEIQAKITELRSQLLVLLNQLVTILRSQLANAQ
jgi:hypothetical protein